MDIKELLTLAVQQDASDLHISAGLPPLVRIDGDLQRLEQPELNEESVLDLLHSVMSEAQRQFFAAHLEVDFSFELANIARFRANVYQQDRGAAGAFRTIPNEIKGLDELDYPPVFKELAVLPRGLVLVTGPTGSGKSTTLAAILHYINQHHYRHILTIEDPIEFIHSSEKCLIHQREVFRDTKSFNAALKSALRQDPDIILVGEMRDIETIRLALTAAETGHLVFGTLHTTSAAKTINRIIDVFPGEEKAMVRSMLSASLEAVIAQTLVKKVGGGRIAVQEIMRCTSAIRNLIREDKVAQIYSAIQTGTKVGMRTLDQHLQELVTRGEITSQIAHEVAAHKEQFSGGE